MTYMSLVANPPKVCLLTGGIAPMLTPVFDVFTLQWERVKERNLRYYEMHAGDVRLVKRIIQQLLKKPVDLPSGGSLTARRFLQLGTALGSSPSAFAEFHSVLSTATLRLNNGDDNDSTVAFTGAFLKYVDSVQSFDDHPIYAWLHESIHADGPTVNSFTNWAAYRAYEELVSEDPIYDYEYTSARVEDDSLPTLFFGEQVFPFMPEDYADLSGVGLTEVANNVAGKIDWGRIYDGDHVRKVLDDGRCKTAAAVYPDDMHVDFDASLKVTAQGGPLENCKVWQMKEHQHLGLENGGAACFGKLCGMATGGNQTSS